MSNNAGLISEIDTTTAITLLYVDDEPNNLFTFRSSFRREYKVFTASSAREALDVLSNNPEIHIIVADEKMPEQTGVEFLELVANKFPDTVRILLTAYSDIKTVINAVNKGQISFYLEKPWNEQHLRVIFKSAHSIYQSKVLLKQKNYELQKANEELSRFVYSASHDLRAPLMSLLGIISIARNEEDKTQREEYWNLMESTIGRLDEFIKNIIDYYKNVRLDNQISEINFDKLFNEVIESHKFFDLTANTEFKIAVMQQERFFGDATRMRIVFNNLISNAIKFQKRNGEKHKVTITAIIEKGSGTFQVEDNGMGISTENREKVFDMFYKINPEVSGSGIGLYIVKETVSRLGGKIIVESEENKGTRFRFTLKNKNS